MCICIVTLETQKSKVAHVHYIYGYLVNTLSVSTTLKQFSVINNQVAIVVLKDKSNGASSSVCDGRHENV